VEAELQVLTAVEIAELYRRVVAGEGRISRAVSAGGLTVIDVDGARVCLAFGLDGAPSQTLWATAPGRERWSYGCERDWMKLGPPLEPLAMVDKGEVGARLWGMEGLPLIADCVFPDFERVAMRQRNAGMGKRRKQSVVS
jgi:hypothetical protein